MTALSCVTLPLSFCSTMYTSPFLLVCTTTNCNWIYLHTIIHKSQPNSLITLTFRSHHETFIRRSWYAVLPDLDEMINCHIKKTVVGMTQLRLFSWYDMFILLNRMDTFLFGTINSYTQCTKKSLSTVKCYNFSILD